MNRTTSTYLDLVRFLAALTVFFVHAGHNRYTGGIPVLWRFNAFGNDAVMVFFVLSGLVIAYVADTKEKTLREYSISRLARLYSVVAPALVATVVLDFIGSRLAPALYTGWYFQSDHPVWRFFANFFFVNELWFWSIKPFTNGPFWSLGYELWYYVLFAAAFYLGRPARYAALAAVCLIVGPKVLLLFPVWLLGVWVYHRMKSRPVGVSAGWLLFGGSVLGYVVFRWTGAPAYLLDWTTGLLGKEFVEQKLALSQEFLASYVIGGLVALHFVGAAAIAPRLAGILGKCEVPIRYLAGFTFSLYLFHYPLLQFFAAAGAPVENLAARGTIVLLGSTFAIWALGSISENRKSDFRRWIAAGYDVVSRTLAAPRKT